MYNSSNIICFNAPSMYDINISINFNNFYIVYNSNFNLYIMEYHDEYIESNKIIWMKI